MIPNFYPVANAPTPPLPAKENPLPAPILNEERREAPSLKDRVSKKIRTGESIKFDHGKLQMENGDIYEGELMNGIPHGKGKMTYRESSKLLTFEGEFFGIGTGHGIALFKDGGRYSGTIRERQFDGIGTLTTSDGAVYSGGFKNHRKNGEGIFTSKMYKYIGVFKDDQFIQGTVAFPDDHPYLKAEGEFLEFKLSKGTLIFKNGVIFTGTMIDSSFQGKGTKELPDGTKFDCEFRRGKIEGIGTASFPDGRKYEGEFKNNAMEGFGTMTYPNGAVYSGQFKNNLRVGKGTFKGPAGQFEGLWVNDNMSFTS